MIHIQWYNYKSLETIDDELKNLSSFKIGEIFFKQIGEKSNPSFEGLKPRNTKLKISRKRGRFFCYSYILNVCPLFSWKKLINYLKLIFANDVNYDRE